jgi:hypothetical protein
MMMINYQYTSLLAYVDPVRVDNSLSQREAVYQVIVDHNGITDLMISKVLNLPINIVTARRNELSKLGRVCIGGYENNTTGHKAIRWLPT